MTNTCYMCNKETTSREHVPPKCLFPSKKDLPRSFDLRKNLISVPSCDVHNSHKSLNDEYLRFLLTSNSRGNHYKSELFHSKVMRAFNRKPHVYNSFMKNSVPIGIKNKVGEFEKSACFEVDLERFDNVMQHIACGLFYHHYRRKWVGGFKVTTDLFVDINSPNAHEINRKTEEISQFLDKEFSNTISIGKNQEIFSYNFISSENDNHAVMMTFYEGSKVTVLLM